MIQLTLMRHANAQWNDPEIADFDRPLSRRGSSEAEAMGRRLAGLGMTPGILLASAARRATQTGEIVARELGLAARNVLSEESLYLAAPTEIVRCVQQIGPHIRHVMVIGHNPGISECANLLGAAPPVDPLGTAAVCSLRFDIADWAQLAGASSHDTLLENPPPRLFALWAS